MHIPQSTANIHCKGKAVLPSSTFPVNILLTASNFHCGIVVVVANIFAILFLIHIVWCAPCNGPFDLSVYTQSNSLGDLD